MFFSNTSGILIEKLEIGIYSVLSVLRLFRGYDEGNELFRFLIILKRIS